MEGPQVVGELGSGWGQLVAQLDEELHELDPDAVLVAPLIDASGLLRLRARFSSPQSRLAGDRLLRDYERRAAVTCELCGGVGRVYAGPVVVIRCASCCGGE